MRQVQDPVLETILTAHGLTAAALGLRFDRVASRVLAALRVHAAGTVPPHRTLLLALAAPIREPGRTVAALNQTVSERATETPGPGSDPWVSWAGTVHGNGVTVRLLFGTASDAPRLIGSVHTDLSRAAILFEAADLWVRGRPGRS